MTQKEINEKIQNLPKNLIHEVVDYIDFLKILLKQQKFQICKDFLQSHAGKDNLIRIK